MALAGLEPATTGLPDMKLVPPREAEVEDVIRDKDSPWEGRIIYTETVLDVEATKASAVIKTEKRMNSAGELVEVEVWKKSPDGTPQYPMLRKTPKFKQIRYILVPNNLARTVKKVTQFEMTAEEKREVERRAREANFFEEFVREAVAQGMTARDVISMIAGQAAEDGEHPAAIDLGVTEDDIEEMAKVEEIAAEAAMPASGMMERSDDDDTVAVDLGAEVVQEVPFEEAQRPPRPKKAGPSKKVQRPKAKRKKE